MNSSSTGTGRRMQRIAAATAAVAALLFGGIAGAGSASAEQCHPKGEAHGIGNNPHCGGGGEGDGHDQVGIGPIIEADPVAPWIDPATPTDGSGGGGGNTGGGEGNTGGGVISIPFGSISATPALGGSLTPGAPAGLTDVTVPFTNVRTDARDRQGPSAPFGWGTGTMALPIDWPGYPTE